jgi:biotin carboxyl carrier protein
VVLSIPVKVGDAVNAADTVMVLEAMKMENSIHAGRNGKVASINVNQGDSVLEGTVLITIE